MANHRITKEKRSLILHLLIEGNTINGICRILSVGKANVLKYLKEVGEACEDWHDDNVRGVEVDYLELDESWSYVHTHKERMTKEKKRENPEAGDSWLWAGICRDSKAIVSWLMADRKQISCLQFCRDLSDRIEGEVTITTDALKSYEWSIASSFGQRAAHAIEHKNFENLTEGKGQRMKKPIDRLVGTDRKAVSGNPDLKMATTSHIERMFLSVRQGNKRCARKTQANSKKLENHQRVMSIFLFTYNLCRKHETTKETPMQTLGITDSAWSLLDVVEMVDEFRAEKMKDKRKADDAVFADAFANWEPRKTPETYEPQKAATPWYHDKDSGGPPVGDSIH